MDNRYVKVAITRETQTTSQQGFSLPLVLSTEKSQAYKEYSGDTALSTIGTDFGADSKTYKLAASIFNQTPKVDKIAVFGIDVAADLSASLDTLILSNNDWYFLACTDQADADITELSDWAEAHAKIYFVSTVNKTLGTTLGAKDRTVLLVHPNPETYPAEAWIGMGATKQPGSFTWTFKTLKGINPANYNDTDINAIEAANASTYIKQGGVNITSKGVATSGEYIDIIQSQDFLQSKMVENVFALLAREDKVPFTAKGIALTVAEVENALRDAYKLGIIADDESGNPIYSVTAPKLSEISAADKANRKLPGVKWSCTIAGAVEDVDVNGSMEI